jgi:peptide/nickel transport system substrate-binding protein
MRLNDRVVRSVIVGLLLTLVLAACAPAAPSGGPAPAGDQASGAASSPARTKRVTAAILGDPRTLRNAVNAAGGAGQAPGVDTVEELLNVGLVTLDAKARLHPRLAEAVPTVENGLWKLLPDGRMETTWKLRPNARWHDGAPFTSDDLAFTATVGQDRDLRIFRDSVYDVIESIQTPDPATVTVLWKRPYIEADILFSHLTASSTVPLPQHILGRSFADDKEGFLLLSYWGTDFVGTGPYRLKSFVHGSHVVMEANEGYVLGRPKLDELEVKFIPDSNTMIGAVLAGAVELTLGRNLSLEQGLQVRNQWRDGRVEFDNSLWMAIFPQFVNPDPPVVTDLRFRRALYHAIDRQAMVDTIQSGMGTVAHSIVIPAIPEYANVEQRAVRYEYDPRRAAQLIEEIGYRRGGDGFMRDSGGRVLGLELRTTKEAHNEEALYPVADYWQRVGVQVDPLVIPPQRISDRPFRAQFPGFEVIGQPNTIKALSRLRLAQTPLPEGNFAGVNRARYMNPEFEAMLERFFTTIPLRERGEALAQVIHHMTDQLVWMGLYHEVNPSLFSNRLLAVTARVADGTQAWNAHEWDLAP